MALVPRPRPVDALLHLLALFLPPLSAAVRVPENEVRLPVLQAVPFRRLQCVPEPLLVLTMVGSLLLRMAHVLRQHRQLTVARLLWVLATSPLHQWPLPVRQDRRPLPRRRPHLQAPEEAPERPRVVVAVPLLFLLRLLSL